MEVTIVSSERIKPSSPTPRHFRTFKLSLLDQLIPAPYAPLILFFPNENDSLNHQVPKRIEVLRESLSETLTGFYPLAGKIEDDLTIECDDSGACFTEAEVSCQLVDFLNQPDLQLMHGFLPCEIGFTGSAVGTPVTNIQVNVFKCGGIAIGLCISHKILDGASLSTFIKSWAGTSSGSKEVVYPSFGASSLFPTNDLWLRDSSIVMWGSLFKMGKSKTTRFFFDSSAISTLKENSTSSNVKKPTQVEVVSSFIWKCAMTASEERYGTKRPSLLSHVVNLRARMGQPLPENSIGNLIWIATARCIEKCDGMGLSELVGRVRGGILKINSEFVKKLRGDEQVDVISKSLNRMKEAGSGGEVDYYGFTSWCNFGFYEADFGWGKPIWVSGVGSGGSVFMNLIVLMETRSGNGIEAWVTLDEEEMGILENDMELRNFALVDPSPLQFNNK